jgi:beta-N-acetylhexosaminidase
MQAAIYGLEGARLTAGERDFFRDADPVGYILFQRNCVDREQLKALTDDLRSLHGRDDLPILIDQEGGRVARMKPPAWPEFPRASRFDDLYKVAPMSAIEAAPVLDVRQPGAHDIIGDRALGSDPMQVASLGRAVLDGLRDGGVVGVVKHMPGHGRSLADSHAELPVVEAGDAELEVDLEPFRKLRDAPMGMVAHLVYTAWDPDRAASLSPDVIGSIIRGRIGFDGLLMSDDLGMSALSGSYRERTAGVLAAGCDLALHCSGRMEEMVEVAAGAGDLGDDGRERLGRAMASIAAAGGEADYQALAAKRDALLAYA